MRVQTSIELAGLASTAARRSGAADLTLLLAVQRRPIRLTLVPSGPTAAPDTSRV